MNRLAMFIGYAVIGLVGYGVGKAVYDNVKKEDVVDSVKETAEAAKEKVAETYENIKGTENE